MTAPDKDRGELGDRGELAKRSRLSWRRSPKEMWGRIHNSERGWELRRSGAVVARIDKTYAGDYYWCAPSCNLWQVRNTFLEGRCFDSLEAAKADCLAWVKAQLAKEPRR